MLGTFKRWLGIDSVKLHLVIEDYYPKSSDFIEGKLEISSKETALITGIQIKCIEKYSRGRSEDLKIDEYLLGNWKSEDRFVVKENELKSIPFRIPLTFFDSPVDKLGQSNILGKGLSFALKKIKAAKSDFRMEAEAVVEGSKFNPRDKATFYFR
jgi:hypothetical protein